VFKAVGELLNETTAPITILLKVAHAFFDFFDKMQSEAVLERKERVYFSG
jgi:hypothetical protein